MPIYEYLCEDCGEFTALRPMRDSAAPCACPECGAAAPRVLISAPALATMSAAKRHAHATNERAAHAPKTSAEYQAGHKHGPGCACGGATSKATLKTPDGAKTFPSKRPWMISH